MRFSVAVLTVSLLICGGALAAWPEVGTAMAQADANVQFTWAFEAIMPKAAVQKPVAIKRDTTLKTGDQFRLLVTLQKRCFVYIL